MHIGGSSPFSKKERVIKEWPIDVQSGYQFLLFYLSKDKQHIVLILGILHVIYFPRANPTQTATILI